MTEYSQIEGPFLDQLGGLGWQVIDRVAGAHENNTVPFFSCKAQTNRL